MGHYDNCRPENCQRCGQTKGHCEHTGPTKTTDPVDAMATRVAAAFRAAVKDCTDPSIASTADLQRLVLIAKAAEAEVIEYVFDLERARDFARARDMPPLRERSELSKTQWRYLHDFSRGWGYGRHGGAQVFRSLREAGIVAPKSLGRASVELTTRGKMALQLARSNGWIKEGA